MKIIDSPTGNPSSVDRLTLLGYDFSHPCQNSACADAQWVTLTGIENVVPASGSTSGIIAGSGGNDLTASIQVTYAGQGSGRVSSVKQWDYASGSYPTSFPYSPAGTAKRETDTAFGHTVNNALFPTDVSTKDSTGTVVSEVAYTYDEAAYFSASPSGVPSHNNALAASQRGNATTISRIPHGGSGSTQTSHVSFDDTGVVTAITNANGYTTTIAHDTTDTYPQTVARPPTPGFGGHSVAHVSQMLHDFNTGQLTSSTDENGQSTILGYDTIGRLSTIAFSDAGSPVTLKTVTYPSVSETDVVVQQVATSYANATIPLSQIVDGYGRTTQVTQAGVTSETAYNGQGIVLSRTNAHVSSQNPTDGQTTYSYDELGRPLSAQLPNGYSSTYAYSLNAVTTTDPLNHQRQLTSDTFGNITTVAEPNSSGSLSWITSYTRNGLGSLKEIDQQGGTTDSTQWRSRFFTYDGLGRLATQTTQEAGQYKYTYDNVGNVTTFANANTSGNTIQYTYDALNRLTQKQVAGGPTYSCTYDGQDASGDSYGIGHLTGSSDGVSVGALYTHDSFGRIISESDSRPSSNGSYSYAMTAAYDFVGNLLTLNYPDGRELAWVYDQFNRPVEQLYAFWNQDQTNVPLMINGTYYPTGQLQDIIDGSGVEVSATVDPMGNTTALNYNNSGTPIAAKTFSWDVNGANLLGIADSATGRAQTYGYDQLNRLVSANDTGTTSTASNPSLPSIPASSESFSYDAWGNLQQSGPYSFSQPIGANNQIVGQGYVYDAAGNLVQDGLGNTYTFRADGHESSSNGVNYAYDPVDQRVVKNGGGANLEYFYFGGTLIATRDAGTGAWNDLLYGAHGILGEVAGTEDANPNYRVGDHLDTLAQTTDDNGDVLGGLTIQPFGQILSNTSGDSYLYTGHEQDAENGSTYTQFRQYSATQGCWLSPDPYAGSYDLSNPQSFNRYTYALNSPLTLADPTGLSPIGITITCSVDSSGNCGSESTGWNGGGDDGGGDGFGYGTGGGVDISFNPQGGGASSTPSGVYTRSSTTYTVPGSNASSILDWIQTALRFAGAILEIGVIFNGANTVLDLARGNYGMAAVDGIATAASFIPGGAPLVEGVEAARVAETAAETVGAALPEAAGEVGLGRLVPPHSVTKCIKAFTKYLQTRPIRNWKIGRWQLPRVKLVWTRGMLDPQVDFRGFNYAELKPMGTSPYTVGNQINRWGLPEGQTSVW